MSRETGSAPVFFLLLLALAAPTQGAGQDVALALSPSGYANYAEHRSRSLSEGDLVVEVWRNGRSTGQVIAVRRSAGQLLMRREDLLAVGVRPDALPSRQGDAAELSLESLAPTITYRLDEPSQTLLLDVAPSALPLQQFGYQPGQAVKVDRHYGAVFNYDLFGRAGDNGDSLSSFTETRLFGPFGALENTAVARAGSALDEGVTRLETRWTRASSDALNRWTVGDTISGSLPWSRSVRLAGVQWRRDFSTRPDLVTFPVPGIATEALLPSTVDLFIDGVRRFEGEANDGPLMIDTLPRISGAGEMTMVVEDILGRETVTTLPFYVDSSLLAPGMNDFSLEAGVLRRNFGLRSDDYGDEAVASGFWRRGWHEQLTGELHFEAADGLGLAGAGAVWLPSPRVGAFNLALAASDGGGDNGTLASLGYEYRGQSAGITVQTLHRSEGYRDLGDFALAGRSSLFTRNLRRQDRLSLYRRFARGTMSYTYVALGMHRGPLQRRHALTWRYTFEPGASRVGGWSLYADLFRDQDGNIGGGLNLTFTFGDGGVVSAGASQFEGEWDARTTVSQRTPFEGGLGWEVSASDTSRPGVGESLRASADYLTDHGDFALGLQRNGSREEVFAQARGGVAVMDGAAFLSRNIADSFAVVSTNGVRDVPVYSENRLFGRTDEQGRILVPNLRGWQSNHLSINPDQVPLHVAVPEVDLLATPADRAGVLVSFPLAERRAARLRLRVETGELLEAGGRVAGPGDTKSLLVGYGGEVYLEDVDDYPWLEAVIAGNRCRFDLSDPAIASRGLGVVSELQCRVDR